MHTRESLSDAITATKARYMAQLQRPTVALELGRLTMIDDLLWQHGERDAATLTLYADMAEDCCCELQSIADRLAGELAA